MVEGAAIGGPALSERRGDQGLHPHPGRPLANPKWAGESPYSGSTSCGRMAHDAGAAGQLSRGACGSCKRMRTVCGARISTDGSALSRTDDTGGYDAM